MYQNTRRMVIFRIVLFVLLLVHWFAILYLGYSFLLVLFILNVVAILVNHRIMKDKYNKKRSEFKYEFKIHDVDQDDNLKKVLKVAVYIFFILLMGYLSRNLEMNDDNLKHNAITFFIFMGVLNYIAFSEADYNFYYFCDDFIVQPGFDLERISRDSVTHMEESVDEKMFWLHFRDRKTLKFDLDTYYIGKPNEKILEFVRKKISEGA